MHKYIMSYTHLRVEGFQRLALFSPKVSIDLDSDFQKLFQGPNALTLVLVGFKIILHYFSMIQLVYFIRKNFSIFFFLSLIFFS